MNTYGTGRKIGVGFNHPLVLEGRMQLDWRHTWDFARRCARLQRNIKYYGQRPLAGSAVDVHRGFVMDVPRPRYRSLGMHP